MVKKNGKLEDAVATLIQNQAAFVAEMREINREMAELKRTSDKRFGRIEERFGRIESMIASLLSLSEKVKEEVAFGFAAWRKQQGKES